VEKGNYKWDNSCGRECYWVTVQKCSRGDGTAKSYVRTLKVNVERCEWGMQLVYMGDNFMPVLNYT
jgi:hypothetical protein